MTRLTGMTKLADANNAGGKHSQRCTLILTEGDSAKALAVAGLGVVGRDNFGVFPLRGKLLNVRDAKHDQIMKNEEIQAVKKIMGLQHNKTYENVSGLRYGRLMIMTDQVGILTLTVKLYINGPAGSRRVPYQRLDHQLLGLFLPYAVEDSRILV
jgi:DNA gyrase/topoisomerase IV subunit B